MKLSHRVLGVAAALAFGALSLPAHAQSSATSPRCNTGLAVDCVELTGSVEFETGATPPSEARVRVTVPIFDAFEQYTLRAVAPDYRFSFRAPRGLPVEISLGDLPTPWLNDQRVTDTVRPASVVVRSAVGVPVTATFRYPQGTVAPPPFQATVRRSVGDRQFTPIEVSNGQFTFFTRVNLPYTISAAPAGFGAVRLEFPAQASAHSVVVDVERAARPVAQNITLVEGAAFPNSFRFAGLIPIVLAERSSSGGGLAPYDLSLLPGSDADGAISLVSSSRVSTTRRQRIGFFWPSVRQDNVRNGARSAVMRLTPLGPGIPAVPDVNLTLLDDEGDTLPPLVTVAGATEAPCCNGVAAVLRRPEGGPGDGWVVTLQLDRPAGPGGAEVTVDTVADLEALDPDVPRGAAVEGRDFQPLTQRAVFAPGARTATVRIEGIGNDRVEPERYFFLAFTDPQGLATRTPVVEMRIVNDEVDQSPAARPDLLPVTPLARGNVLEVLANDVLPAARYPAGQLEITSPPRFGTATVDTAGTATPVDDRIVYTPQAGRAGQADRLRYRLCGPLDDGCVAARVDIPIRAVPTASPAWSPGTDAGFRDFTFSGLPALADARFEVLARPIHPSEVVRGSVAPNTPTRFALAWNANLPLPALGAGQAELARIIFVHLEGETLSDLDLHVAYDANADGAIADEEILCSSASVGTVETCLTPMLQTATGPRELRIAVSNPGPNAAGYRLLRAGIDGVRPIAGVVATGPTRLREGEAFPVRLGWRNDATPLRGGAVGLLRLRNADGASLGDVPLAIVLAGSAWSSGASTFGGLSTQPIGLRSGEAMSVQVPVGELLDRVFVDVPPGTAQLVLSATRPAGSAGGIQASLRRVPLPAGASDALITRAPQEDATSVTRSSFGDLDVIVNAPAPGRWFVVLGAGAPSGEPPVLTVTASLNAGTPAPVVRPGGYFNPARSGHGLFVYPAGNDWAGLWYTYAQDGSPVWYYLQGAVPGANGIWTAPIFRSGWNGSQNHLTEVGRATITPTANDAFQFTYVLDGEIGSEPFVSFGRGCPSIDGRVINASGHWFDPARAGTGYSVQLLPNAEFHAVFAYSGRGEPRFLVAERNGVGAANDTAPLQQLRGFCPLCARAGNPTRSTVGVLRREFVNGQLARINVDATFAEGTPGTWTVNDAVVPLGGLQGCAAN